MNWHVVGTMLAIFAGACGLAAAMVAAIVRLAERIGLNRAAAIVLGAFFVAAALIAEALA